MSHIDVMKQALEALEQWNTPLYKRGNVITALRRALAVSETHKQHLAAPQRREDKKQWVGLTDEEIDKMTVLMGINPEWKAEIKIVRSVVRNLEAKLREKNA